MAGSDKEKGKGLLRALKNSMFSRRRSPGTTSQMEEDATDSPVASSQLSPHVEGNSIILVFFHFF